jgi:CDP-diacylglycerol pyrophosphatase
VLPCVSGDPIVDRDVALALTMKLGLHATQPQASLWIHFHLSCVRLDKVTNAIYFSNFKNGSTLSPYLFVHFTRLHHLHGAYQITEEIMSCSEVVFSKTRKLCPVMTITGNQLKQ